MAPTPSIACAGAGAGRVANDRRHRRDRDPAAKKVTLAQLRSGVANERTMSDCIATLASVAQRRSVGADLGGRPAL
ncbi:MAG: hypothetical protein JWP01_2569 [Myxococcales bacterium]|nr:hypothetical protein [Myxococcales bacterium]